MAETDWGKLFDERYFERESLELSKFSTKQITFKPTVWPRKFFTDIPIDSIFVREPNSITINCMKSCVMQTSADNPWVYYKNAQVVTLLFGNKRYVFTGVNSIVQSNDDRYRVLLFNFEDYTVDTAEVKNEIL